MINGHPLTVSLSPEADLLERDPESWSRLKGLQAMLALPPVGISKALLRGRMRWIEILATDGTWHRINEAKLLIGGVLVCAMVHSTGPDRDPVRREFHFDPWFVPAWRTDDGFAPGEDKTLRATLEPK